MSANEIITIAKNITELAMAWTAIAFVLVMMLLILRSAWK